MASAFSGASDSVGASEVAGAFDAAAGASEGELDTDEAAAEGAALDSRRRCARTRQFGRRGPTGWPASVPPAASARIARAAMPRDSDRALIDRLQRTPQRCTGWRLAERRWANLEVLVSRDLTAVGGPSGTASPLPRREDRSRPRRRRTSQVSRWARRTSRRGRQARRDEIPLRVATLDIMERTKAGRVGASAGVSCAPVETPLLTRILTVRSRRPPAPRSRRRPR